MTIYRNDLWRDFGVLPDSWENIRKGGRQIRLLSRAPDRYRFPTFPGTIPNLAQLVSNNPQARPSDQYQKPAGAADWSVFTYRGYDNVAIRELEDIHLLRVPGCGFIRVVRHKKAGRAQRLYEIT